MYDGREKVWRKPNIAVDPTHFISTVKYGGGNVTVLEVVATSGVGNLAFIEGRRDRFQYKTILENSLQTSVDKLCLGSSWIFHQDNDPKHTAQIVE